MGKRCLILLIASSLCVSTAKAHTSSTYTSRNSALVQGYDSFRNGDWNSASIFLRRAILASTEADDVTWFMLIMSEIYSENFQAAVSDADTFFDKFPESSLISSVAYQKGRALHSLGRNDSAVLVLSDFCHQNPNSDMYGSALYWIAECFYDDYNFDTAKSLYERVVYEFPDSPKFNESEERLEAILQREREQKLLYLLKMTGEEYLSSRENYERRLRAYQTEDSLELRKELAAAKERIAELETSTEHTDAVSLSGPTANILVDDDASDSLVGTGSEKATSIDELQSLFKKVEELRLLLQEKSLER